MKSVFDPSKMVGPEINTVEEEATHILQQEYRAES